MLKKFRIIRVLILTLILAGSAVSVYSQGNIDNATRAVFIFDIARYIDYGPGFVDSAVFRIGVLDRDEFLFLELGNLRKTRPAIQGKPVILVKFNSESQITYTQLLYVNKASGFSLDKVKEAIANHQTLLLTEGYEFRESMINFMGVEGEMPKYSVNEDLINKAGMKVNSNMLTQAIKTREDWERLFGKASKEIIIQRDTIRQQLLTIQAQKTEILHQKALLDSLDKEISAREKTLNDKQKILESQYIRINKQQGEIASQKKTITEQMREVKVQQDTLANQKRKISLQESIIGQKLRVIAEQDSRIKLQLATLEKQKLILYFVILALLLVSILGYYIYRGYKIKKEANIRLEEKNKTISLQKDEIEKQRDIAAAQRDQIAYQKKHITDSIMYAKRIQTALIPSLELFSDKLEHFVLYKPLAIVSGDFYWVSSAGSSQIIIAADCTGHGVPGAFMSMLGVTLLNEIVIGKHIAEPDRILENLRQGVIKSLNQAADEDSIKDGMDIAICRVDFNTDTLWYAGANSPLFLVRGGELIHYRADKMPVAIHYKMGPFTLHEIKLHKGDAFYIFSDGYADQFGGPKQKKYMTTKMKETLVSIEGLSMIQQGEKMNEIFEEWKGDNPQVDDVTLIGVRY